MEGENGGVLTVAVIDEAIRRAKSLKPTIKPSVCKCGKHSWYNVISNRSGVELWADSLSDEDLDAHIALQLHITKCGVKSGV